MCMHVRMYVCMYEMRAPGVYACMHACIDARDACMHVCNA